MRPSSWILWVFAIAAVPISVAPALAQSQCYDACESWSECDMQCYDGGQLSTCGEWGTCDPHCCATECHPATIPCDHACRDCGGTEQWTTCEGTGFDCEDCAPHYILYDSVVIGAYPVEIFPSNTCDYHLVEQREYRDENECPNSEPQFSCVDFVYYTDSPAWACCAYNWCGGQMCS